MKNVLILPCAGSGKRFGSCKQLRKLNNRAIFLRALDSFVGLIHHVIIPSSCDIQNDMRALLTRESFPFDIHIIDGGSTRFESVYNGIAVCPNDSDYILVHDAARPFVEKLHIQQCLAALSTHQAAILATPCRDSLKKDSGENIIANSVNRDQLWMAQTPQVFRASIAHDVYQRARTEAWACNDDAELFERAGYEVALIQGSPLNIKLTYPEDWELAEIIIHRKT